jgi:hypothetical protein
VLHYGVKWGVPNTTWAWHKAWYHNRFDVTACPPWNLSVARPASGLFPLPPRPSEIPSMVLPCIPFPPVLSLHARAPDRP